MVIPAAFFNVAGSMRASAPQLMMMLS